MTLSLRAFVFSGFLVGTAAVATAAQGVPQGQRPIQGGQAGRLGDLTRAATITLVCRGGRGLAIENRGPSRTSSGLVTLSLAFAPVDQPAGADGSGLGPGTCSAVDRALAPGEPTRIQVDTDAPGRIEQELRDPGRVWRFETVRAQGYFNATSSAPVAGASVPSLQRPGRDRGQLQGGTMVQGQGRAAIPPNVLDMDDRAIIIVGGREVRAGDIKRDILQNVPPPRGIGQRVTAPPRSPAQMSTTMMSRQDMGGGLQQADRGPTRGAMEAASAIDCGRGPMTGRMQGVVSPGQTLSIAGACFGTVPGTIEIIGQFAGPNAGRGPLRMDFISWKDGEIIARTPPVSGADQVVSLTVVRADGKRSVTKPATFVASRERVEVPNSYWQPSSHYVWRGVYESSYNVFSDNFDGTRYSNNGPAPPSNFFLRINPACALESMDATPRVGAVTGIFGWTDAGPPHEANVRIGWQSRRTRTNSTYVTGHESITVYDIEFDLRASAMCPVGIRP